MEWGILIILIVLVLVAYVIVQETRAQMHWRGLVAEGNVPAIRELIENEVEHWHDARVPRGTPALLWHGVQTVELLDVNATAALFNCSAEGEFSLIDGKRVETSSALNEGMKITMKLAEMIFYDIPNVKLDRLQVDVYTSFRDESGRADPRCILSTRIERAEVEHIDWEQTPPEEFVALNTARFDAGESGTIHAVEPLPWEEGATRSV